MNKIDLDILEPLLGFKFKGEFPSDKLLREDMEAVIKELKASRKIIKCLRKIRTSDCGDLEEIYKALDELDGNNV